MYVPAPRTSSSTQWHSARNVSAAVADRSSRSTPTATTTTSRQPTTFPPQPISYTSPHARPRQLPTGDPGSATALGCAQSPDTAADSQGGSGVADAQRPAAVARLTPDVLAVVAGPGYRVGSTYLEAALPSVTRRHPSRQSAEHSTSGTIRQLISPDGSSVCPSSARPLSGEVPDTSDGSAKGVSFRPDASQLTPSGQVWSPTTPLKHGLPPSSARALASSPGLAAQARPVWQGSASGGKQATGESAHMTPVAPLPAHVSSDGARWMPAAGGAFPVPAAVPSMLLRSQAVDAAAALSGAMNPRGFQRAMASSGGGALRGWQSHTPPRLLPSATPVTLHAPDNAGGSICYAHTWTNPFATVRKQICDNCASNRQTCRFVTEARCARLPAAGWYWPGRVSPHHHRRRVLVGQTHTAHAQGARV
jgi:hypothetical protein